MSDDDAAYLAWACKRHTWLWRNAFSRSTWRPLRFIYRKAVIAAARADFVYWRHWRT